MTTATAIYTVIQQIPKGKVATYGQIARLAGLNGAARLVGQTLHRLPEDSTLPWHRVINARGKISLPPDTQAYLAQRQRLCDEGVIVTGDTISLNMYQWRP